MKRFAWLLAAALLTTACQEVAMAPGSGTDAAAAPGPGNSALAKQLSGKFLSNDKVSFALAPDGKVVGGDEEGDAIRGTWRIDANGRLCRDIAEPEALVGAKCETVSIVGRDVTLTAEDGTKTAFLLS